MYVNKVMWYIDIDISTHEPCFVFDPLIVPHVTGKLLKTVSSRFFFSLLFLDILHVNMPHFI